MRTVILIVIGLKVIVNKRRSRINNRGFSIIISYHFTFIYRVLRNVRIVWLKIYILPVERLHFKLISSEKIFN